MLNRRPGDGETRTISAGTDEVAVLKEMEKQTELRIRALRALEKAEADLCQGKFGASVAFECTRQLQPPNVDECNHQEVAGGCAHLPPGEWASAISVSSSHSGTCIGSAVVGASVEQRPAPGPPSAAASSLRSETASPTSPTTSNATLRPDLSSAPPWPWESRIPPTTVSHKNATTGAQGSELAPGQSPSSEPAAVAAAAPQAAEVMLGLAGKPDLTDMGSTPTHVLAQICAQQAARLTELERELLKVQDGDNRLEAELLDARTQCERNRIEYDRKLSQMAKLQARLQTENEELFAELERAAQRIETLKREVQLIQQRAHPTDVIPPSTASNTSSFEGPVARHPVATANTTATSEMRHHATDAHRMTHIAPQRLAYYHAMQPGPLHHSISARSESKASYRLWENGMNGPTMPVIAADSGALSVPVAGPRPSSSCRSVSPSQRQPFPMQLQSFVQAGRARSLPPSRWRNLEQALDVPEQFGSPGSAPTLPNGTSVSTAASYARPQVLRHAAASASDHLGHAGDSVTNAPQLLFGQPVLRG